MEKIMRSPVKMEQESAQQKVDICEEILRNARSEIYMNMRFLDVALHALLLHADFSEHDAGTDGFSFFYHPDYLLNRFQRGRVWVNRLYLHSMLHGIFVHMDNRKGRIKEIWNLSCDITVEWILDHLHQPSIHVPLTPYRREFYMRMKEELHVVTAEGIYHYLQQKNADFQQLARWVGEFYVDDHGHWEADTKQPRITVERKKKWEKNREQMQTELETFSKEKAEDAKELYEQLAIENRERYDYRNFLRKFTVWKETQELDLDAFDYIYYDYGMRRYGNIPLIEPLETKEVKRIQDFVIVIDTSMSCSGDLVKRFLEETYQILSEAETFFKKVNIHIIQCDDQVRGDRWIRERGELEQYMEQIEIRGKGGTDFRPAFEYVDGLLKKGELNHLKGLIYFTDGYGIFPVKMPVYDTAFVFWREDYCDVDVPSWAIKLILGGDDLSEKIDSSRV